MDNITKQKIIDLPFYNIIISLLNIWGISKKFRGKSNEYKKCLLIYRRK